MKYSSKNKPIECILKNSTCYKNTGKATPIGILWHSTGANNTSIARYVQPYETDPNYNKMISLLGKNKYRNDWNHIELLAGVNAFIGKLADGTIATVQTLPWDYAPWGCGKGKYGSCNGQVGGKHFIQFEICEDALTDKSYFNKVYKEACELTAYLCKTYNLNPNGTVLVNGVKTPVILCHADSYKLGLGSNHGDVLHWFNRYGKTMNDVRKDVAALMARTTTTSATKFGGKINGYNITRQTDYLVIYNSGKNATTNKWGTEVAVNSDGVAICSPVYGVGSMSIPSGGYVISGHGVASDWILKNIKKGSKITIVDGVVKVGTVVSTTTTTTTTNNSSASSASSSFKIGEEVKLVSGAKYTSGGSIPNWLFNSKLYVRDIQGNNIVFSTMKTGAVTGVVSKQYLIKYTNSAISNNKTTSTPASTVLKVGDKVKLKSGACVYGTKTTFASFVYNSTLYVREINGDKIVISTQKTGAITGTVAKSGLIKI